MWTDVSETTTSFGPTFQMPEDKEYERFEIHCRSESASRQPTLETVGREPARESKHGSKRATIGTVAKRRAA